jgi:hypothetical protein
VKAARLKRKLARWNRYAWRLERLGQAKLYNAHIYYIAYEVMEKVRKGSADGILLEAKRP